MKGDIYSENEYCAYHLEQKNIEKKYQAAENPDELFASADSLVKYGAYQEASVAFARIIELEPKNEQAFIAKAYAEYMCGNYELCKADNEKAIDFMRRAAAIPGPRQEEHMEDLRIMLM